MNGGRLVLADCLRHSVVGIYFVTAFQL